MNCGTDHAYHHDPTPAQRAIACLSDLTSVMVLMAVLIWGVMAALAYLPRPGPMPPRHSATLRPDRATGPTGATLPQIRIIARIIER